MIKRENNGTKLNKPIQLSGFLTAQKLAKLEQLSARKSATNQTNYNGISVSNIEHRTVYKNGLFCFNVSIQVDRKKIEPADLSELREIFDRKKAK